MLQQGGRADPLLAEVDHGFEGVGKGKTMDTKDMFDAFDERVLEEHRTKYADEAKQRWGTTDAYAESQKRTSKYTRMTGRASSTGQDRSTRTWRLSWTTR